MSNGGQRERNVLNHHLYRLDENPYQGANGTDSSEYVDLSYLGLDADMLASYLEINSNVDRELPEENSNTSNEQRNRLPLIHHKIKTLLLHNNNITSLPIIISRYAELKVLDLSHNSLTMIPSDIVYLQKLNALVVKNNYLTNESLPKDFGTLKCLDMLNLSGNHFTQIPEQIFEIRSLKSLYMGGNQLESISTNIAHLQSLEILYLGGNHLSEVPAEVGLLRNLRSLVLCENQLQSLPSTISCLNKLRSLALHRNLLTTLPPKIVALKELYELSLRDNPLVVRFVKELTYTPPSLLELAARAIKVSRLRYDPSDLPVVLQRYLNSAQRCVNPRCKGVYFDTRVEHIKFVDFCGKYRLPLLEYLCSPSCSDRPAIAASDDSSDDDEVPANRLRRVLLG